MPDKLQRATRDMSQLTRVKVVASYGYLPLATLDHDDVGSAATERTVTSAKLNDGLDAWRDNYGELAPEELGLSPQLCRDLDDWSWDYQKFFNETDPAAPHCTPEHDAAHEAQGLSLALRVQEERPDLIVYTGHAGGELVAVGAPGQPE